MKVFALSFVAIALLVRHGHHFWVTRHVARSIHKQGRASVTLWFIGYVVLMVAMLYRLFDDLRYINFWIGSCTLLLAVAGRMVS
ncbi:MAG: hypothetical protein JW795_14965, partial [Chitinivibrionales bacterium]|nr:hypothetical protein [Chitinivibrionales bacterium]